ncbi:diaminopropionate ammonia-lyase [Eubacteriaceae bacterium ES3]|nr:diaminopropionate ammonia-lyase [Eubacteriaceae bacterium ES3]
MDPEIKMIENEIKASRLTAEYSQRKIREVEKYHKSLAEYETTPLISLKGLAENLGIKNIFIKDESKRFGLNSFKALGASFAIHKIIAGHQGDEKPVFVTATDGNHGKGVAWAAQRIGCEAHIFMPADSKECRVRAIKNFLNARVEVTNRNYDDTVRFAQAYARENGYYLVQDTGLEGYEQVPQNIAYGYSTMVSEAYNQMDGVRPSHIFIQAGGGSMASGVIGTLRVNGDLPFISIMEAMPTACFFQSVKNGKCSIADNDGNTIMAGMNCGEPNPLAYPIIKNNARAFFSCPDWVTKIGIRKMAAPEGDDPIIESGESGAIGLGLLMILMRLNKYHSMKEKLGLNSESVILLFNTEGFTDEENCRNILAGLN